MRAVYGKDWIRFENPTDENYQVYWNMRIHWVKAHSVLVLPW